MFKELRISAWFILGLIIWAAVVVLRRNSKVIPFVNDHLTDLYAVPMFSYMVTKIMNHTYYPDWRPSLTDLLSFALNLTIVFEILFPMFSESYTSDYRDVVCYFTGALIYFLFLKSNTFIKEK